MMEDKEIDPMAIIKDLLPEPPSKDGAQRFQEGGSVPLITKLRISVKLISPAIVIIILTVSKSKQKEIGKTARLATKSISQDLKPSLLLGKAPIPISRGAIIILKMIEA